MDLNRLTEKSQQALSEAQSLAVRLGHRGRWEHLLLALLTQSEGLVPRLISQAGGIGLAWPRTWRRSLPSARVSAVPGRTRGDPGDPTSGQASRLGGEGGDTSQGRIRVGGAPRHRLSRRGGHLGQARLLTEQGITRDRFLESLTAIRGNQRVTSATPESAYEALEKYGQDLVADARSGKLDPVIGRDSEIRRAIQILSRRPRTTRPDRRPRGGQDRHR